MDKLITIKEASKILSVSTWYLRRLDETVLKPYKTSGGHRRYKESDVLSLIGIVHDSISDCVIIYCRVSSNEQKQKGDLSRQKERLCDFCIRKGYKIIEVYEEVGSGMNDNRQKLKEIIKKSTTKTFSKIIIEHKDRLTRFNFNVFKLLFSTHDIEIECVEEILPKSFENELVEDIISLMTSFSAKIYGKRSHKNKNN